MFLNPCALHAHLYITRPYISKASGRSLLTRFSSRDAPFELNEWFSNKQDNYMINRNEAC